MIRLTPEGYATLAAAVALIVAFMVAEDRRRRTARELEQRRVHRMVAEITAEATMHGHASRGRAS